MSQSRTGGGALIVTIIIIGVAYVSFSMFTQGGDNSSGAPQVHSLHTGYGKINDHDNPYIEALLNPGTTPDLDKYRSGRHLSKLLRAQLSKKGDSSGGDFAAASTANNVGLSLLSDQVQSAARSDNPAAGSEAAKSVLAFCREHQKEASSAMVDLLIDSARVSKKALNFDLSRDCVNQAILQARRINDYKMDDIEGLRCILNGNRDELVAYNTAMTAFNEKLSHSEYSALPPLADDLMQKTKFLPEDSYFKMQAELCKAISLGWTKAPPAETREAIEKVQKEAQSVQDQTIIAQCQEIANHFAIINGR